MADNNRNWGGYRSSNQDWNDSNSRYGMESDYDDRGAYRGRHEGGQGNSDWNRSGQDYGQGSTYGEGRYDRDDDYNRNRGQSMSRGRYNEDNNDFNDSSYYGGSENRSRDYGSSTYGRGFGEGRIGERGFGSRYGRERQSYAPGGYTNYGGGSGYGSNQWTGGYGGTNYGRNLGSTGSSYGSSYGTTGGGLHEGYGAGFGFGERSGLSDRGYDRSYRGDYGSRMGRGGYQGDLNRGREEERGWWDKATDEVSSWFGDEEAEHRREMDRRHRGKGPKNYQRSDERIKEDINDRLSDDWFIDASDIDVSVEKGEVTLTGTVDERTSKRRAEDIAESVSGVKHVENRLRVSSMQNTYGSTSTMGAATSTTGTGSTTTTGSTTKSRQSGVVNETNK